MPNDRNPTHLVRYEDIVQEDISALRKLEQFCGFGPDTETYSGVPLAALSPESPFFQEILLQPVSNERVGGYAEILSQNELLQTEELFADVIERFGYRTWAAFGRVRSLEAGLHEFGSATEVGARTLAPVRQDLHEVRLAQDGLSADLGSARERENAAAAERNVARMESDELRSAKSSLRQRVSSLQSAAAEHNRACSRASALRAEPTPLREAMATTESGRSEVRRRIEDLETTREELGVRSLGLHVTANALRSERDTGVTTLKPLKREMRRKGALRPNRKPQKKGDTAATRPAVTGSDEDHTGEIGN